MSTAGTYNFHPKVAQPNKVFYQMESDTFQPHFYFGASQVPINLGMEGQGFKTGYVSHIDRMKQLPTQGRGIHTTRQKQHNIYLPKHLSTIKQVI